MSGGTITLEGVWKSYPRSGGRTRTVRAVVLGRVPGLRGTGERRWALRDVGVTVPGGSLTGLIGSNGAGKSTLLRLASGVGRPDRGRIALPDDSASVLSLGYAFDPDLAGDENAYTAAVMAGLSAREARAAVPRAVTFAELEAFADAPLRTYSDGMKLRLAFGVVAQLEPAALLVDEVLAVGDLRFQQKCLDRIDELRAGGTAVLLASHGLEQVEQICDRAVWLQAGGVRATGPAAEVVGAYREAMRSETVARTPQDAPGGATGALELQRNRFGSQELTIEDVRLTDAGGGDGGEIESGGRLDLRFLLRPRDGRVAAPIVGVSVHRVADGALCCDLSTQADGVLVPDVDEPVEVEVSFPALELAPGDYVLDVGAYEPGWSFAYDYHWNAYPLRVVGPSAGRGVFRPPHAWRLGGA